jgi:hypothetical protein
VSSEPPASPLGGGQLLAAVTREIVRLRAGHYGKGPTKARSCWAGDSLVCQMEEGAVVERLTGRRVRAFLSQVNLDPESTSRSSSWSRARRQADPDHRPREMARARSPWRRTQQPA